MLFEEDPEVSSPEQLPEIIASEVPIGLEEGSQQEEEVFTVEERFAEDHVVLSDCDDERPVEESNPNYPYCDDDYEAFKALPVLVPNPSPQVIPEVPLSHVEQNQAKAVCVASSTFKISPDHPQIKVYRGYLKLAMGKGDIQELAELVYEIKD